MKSVRMLALGFTCAQYIVLMLTVIHPTAGTTELQALLSLVKISAAGIIAALVFVGASLQ
jgi:hypothetical protein